MTTPVPPISEPDPSMAMCRGDQAGPCVTCHRKTHRYGHGGTPLCSWCAAERGVTIVRGPLS
ncbi:hypothetical protein [Streptomyces sp. NPDC086782]|uniref:hypothetical protein n=1 Tax=Streptomyces sp. NPDC086782 TaxID=3365757 RepID=UPI00381AADF2